MDKTVIGKRLRYERQKLGLTQEELGNRVGVTPMCVASWEKSRNLADILTLNKLSKIFGIELKDFLTLPDTIVAETRVEYDVEDDRRYKLSTREALFIEKLRSIGKDKRKALEVLVGIR